MKCACIHVVDYLSVHIDVKQNAVSRVPPVIENVVDDALILLVKAAVRSCVCPAINRVPGCVLITSATVFVGKNASGLAVMLLAQKNSPAAIHVLVCVEKTVPQSVLFVTPKSSLLC